MDWATELYEALQPIISSEGNYPEARPLLAHYTSLSVLEAIAAHGEVWMSHPLLMNDTQELIGGLDAARTVFLKSAPLQEGLGERAMEFLRWYETFESQFLTSDAFDTYIFCLCEHDPDDYDGALSMWRGYGGNGGGAAIVFRTASLIVVEETPFILGRVSYRSAEQRDELLASLAKKAAAMLQKDGPIDQRPSEAAMILFRAALQCALFTKHSGFREEKEWRLVYMREMDPSPGDRRLHVHLGARGAEPKLRLAITTDPLLSGAPIHLDNLIERILLGPTASSKLAVFAVQRMLGSHERTRLLSSSVTASTTPFRVLA